MGYGSLSRYQNNARNSPRNVKRPNEMIPMLENDKYFLNKPNMNPAGVKSSFGD